MKTIVTIIAIAISTLTASGQCDSIPPLMQMGYSTGSHTFCVPGTYIIGAPYAGWVRINPTYCDTNTCTFSVNGGPPTLTASITFTPSAPGITTFVIIGMNPNYPACTQTVVLTFTTVACQYTYTAPPVGIEEYENNASVAPIYYDMLGTVIELRYNEVIFERRGRYIKLVRYEK